MQETLHDHHTSIPISGRPMYNRRFVDDKDMGDSNGELQDLNDRLMYRTRPYGMNVCTEKSMVMTNSTNNISADISMNSQKLEEVTNFNYLEATLCKDGTRSAEIRIRIAQTKQTLAVQHH